jgi:predicted alpha/beta superfamily hydrolase
MKRILLLPALFMALSRPCLTQSADHDRTGTEKYLSEIGERFNIESGILRETKEIYVGLPAGYNDSTEYPLVIILEAEILFETLAPLTRLMAEVNEIPHCILVGIPFYNKHLDYAPKIPGVQESGNADKMLDFYREELFPCLAARYHCTEQRIIWAHSGLGGIFCTYLLLGPDDQFSGILSSSPNLRWMQEYVKDDTAFVKLARKGRIFYYLTFGSAEEEAYMGSMYKGVEEFRERLEKEAPGNLVWKFQLYENNNHFTNALETFIDGLRLYFKLMEPVKDPK